MKGEIYETENRLEDIGYSSLERAQARDNRGRRRRHRLVLGERMLFAYSERQDAAMGVYAFGIPGIAVISQTTQAADNKGEDTNVPVQANPVDVGQ